MEREYVGKVLDSGRLSYGQFSKRFEKKFANEHGCEFGVFVNSGTSALHISLAALKQKYGWRDGDEVIIPAVTFVATANIVLHNGMVPIFVDVDKRTYNIDAAKIVKKITSRTRAIIPVHLMGLPCDMKSIVGIAKTHNLKIIEDSCETVFSRYDGEPVGSFGDIGCFSTYVAHYIVTGVGGLATTNDPEIAVLLRSLANHGRDSIYISIDDDNVSGKKLEEVIAKRFSFTSLGHSFRCTEMEAALGLAQMASKEKIIKARKQNAIKLIAGLDDLQDHIQLPYWPADRDHMFMLFPIVTKNEKKQGLVRHLEKSGIETRDLMPLINQPIYRKLYSTTQLKNPLIDFSIASWLDTNGFYIGCHQYMSDNDISYVIKTIKKYFKAL